VDTFGPSLFGLTTDQKPGNIGTGTDSEYSGPRKQDHRLSYTGAQKRGHMAGKRKSHSAAFKAQVALAAIKGDQTINQVALKHDIHTTLIHAWKKPLLAGAEGVFASGAKTTGPPEDKTAELYEQIGRLKVELDWVKKNRLPSVDARRGMIDWEHLELSVRRQCELLGLNRSTLYYEAVPETAENLSLMRLIDEEYTKVSSPRIT